MNKKHCVGCYDDFYNHPGEHGAKECWSLKAAKLIKRKRVPISQPPPWNQPSEIAPSCYHELGYVYVKPDQTM